MAGRARAASPENIKPRSTGSHVVYDMPLVLIHENHKVPTVHPDTGTGTTETGNGGSERRNDPVGVRVTDGIDNGLEVSECRRRVDQWESNAQQDSTNPQR